MGKILIENAYVYRRPWMPGNPNGRARGYTFQDSFAYPDGQFDLVNGGKWTSTSEAYGPPNETASMLTGAVVCSNNATTPDIQSITGQPLTPVSVSYSVECDFTFVTQSTGLIAIDLTMEGGATSGGTFKIGKRVEISGGTGGFPFVSANDEGGNSLFHQNVDIGQGSGILPPGKHTLKAVVGVPVGSARLLTVTIDGVVQYSDFGFGKNPTGALFGFYIQGSLNQILMQRFKVSSP